MLQFYLFIIVGWIKLYTEFFSENYMKRRSIHVYDESYATTQTV